MRTSPDQPCFGTDWITPRTVAGLSELSNPIHISDEAYALIDSARTVIDATVAHDIPAYGVTRGLGPLRDQRIPNELQHTFQEFVFASHDAATGPLLSRAEVRAIMIARLSVMARGNSGASRGIVDGVKQLLDADITPAISGEGSVGSADLAALAMVGLVLTGQGRVLNDAGESVPAGPVLEAAGFAPAQLFAKDAHSLVVTNSSSLGLACRGLVRLDRLAAMVDLTAAHTIESLGLNLGIFAENLMLARPHPGQILSAARMRSLFAGGDLAGGEFVSASLQDPLSVRAIPQVHGSLLESIAHLEEVLAIELNSKPENPFIDHELSLMISNGNFSSIRMSMALEQVRLLVAHTMMMTERRIALMVKQLRSGRTLVEQVVSYSDGNEPIVPVVLANTAAALTTRIQHLALPVSAFDAVVGDGVEDHNAQAYAAVRALDQTLGFAEQLLSIEALVASGITILSAEAPKRRRSATLAQFNEGVREIIYRNRTGDTTSLKLLDVEQFFDTVLDTAPHTHLAFA